MVLVDDSIVRGTTSRKIVKMVRAAGATEVHVRISCPPTISPCFYGVDTPRRSELIAATHTLEEITTYLNADSVGYLSHDGMLSVLGSERGQYCSSCYTGHYPVSFPRDEATLSPARAEARQGRRSSPGDHERRRVRCVLPVRLCGFLVRACVLRAQQEPTQPQAVSAAELRAAIDSLGKLDYDTRTRASRTIRRSPAAQAVPALMQTVSDHPDGYVRYRALVLLTGFNDPRARDVMRDALTSPNDRLRSVGLQLLRAQSRPRPRAEPVGGHGQGDRGIRPPVAGSRAGGAGRAFREIEGTRVRAVLMREAGRGQDFFRTAVIEALGDFKAKYAVRHTGRDCRARRSAAERHRDRARQDRRPACPERAGEPAAFRARSRRSRTSRRRSVCSASTAKRTRSFSSRRLKFADTNPGYPGRICARRPRVWPPSRSPARRKPPKPCSRSAFRRAILRARRCRWRSPRSRCAARR